MRRALLFMGALVIAAVGATALAEREPCEPDLGLVPGHQFINGGGFSGGDFSPGENFLVDNDAFGQGSGDRLGQGSGDRLLCSVGDEFDEIDDGIPTIIDGDL